MKDLMKKFNMAELKPVSTPLSTATALDLDENRKAVHQREYLSSMQRFKKLVSSPILKVLLVL
jgi:hypothetical protein